LARNQNLEKFDKFDLKEMDKMDGNGHDQGMQNLREK
jgi:hypothetical protein